MDNQECNDCVFYINGLMKSMECRRFPPHVLEDDDDRIAAIFPNPEPFEWCGEFVAREDKID